MAERKRIALLGASGSIGQSTLKVLRKHADKLELVAVAAKSSGRSLAQIAKEFSVPYACLSDEGAYAAAKGELPQGTELLCGAEGLVQLASLPEVDTVVMAIVGTDGLDATLAALTQGKRVALASKEIIVLAGKWVMDCAAKHGGEILPVDSEHSAIYQCLEGHHTDDIHKVILTASGGAFRDYAAEQMHGITLEQALKHPNWDMGSKVTIDSASLANKGLELFEARWLFGLEAEKLDVVVHRQSLVHSLVQFRDGNVIAQMGPPQMSFPIQYALLYPERGIPTDTPIDWKQTLQMDFCAPDLERFKCLKHALEALKTGGMAPGIFNTANEVAVDAFCEQKIHFLDIQGVIEHCLAYESTADVATLEEALDVREHTRRRAEEFIG